MTDPVEQGLQDAGAAFRAQPTPDLAGRVRDRLAAEPATRQPQRRPVRRRALLAVGTTAVALALVPGVRAGVVDLVDAIPGIALRLDQGGGGTDATESASQPWTGQPLGEPFGLVDPTTLEAARAAVPFELPVSAEVGEPATVYVREGVVTMLWPASPALPALPGSAVGLIIDVVDGSHGPLFEKLLLDVDVEWLEIDGTPAAWVDEPHPLVVVNADGIPDRELDRVAARTLLVSGSVTIRVESMLDRDAAIELVRGPD